MLIVSTLMALIAALVNKDILEMEQSVEVIILDVIIETIGHTFLPRNFGQSMVSIKTCDE